LTPNGRLEKRTSRAWSCDGHHEKALFTASPE
jgi:hypothetical protein